MASNGWSSSSQSNHVCVLGQGARRRCEGDPETRCKRGAGMKHAMDRMRIMHTHGHTASMDNFSLINMKWRFYTYGQWCWRILPSGWSESRVEQFMWAQRHTTGWGMCACELGERSMVRAHSRSHIPVAKVSEVKTFEIFSMCNCTCRIIIL